MADNHTVWKHARGTSDALDAYAGPVGEVVVDTTTSTLRVQNGTTGGMILARKPDLDAVASQVTTLAGTTATSSANGLMSSVDKAKLDGMAAQATRTAVTVSYSSGTSLATISINGEPTVINAPAATSSQLGLVRTGIGLTTSNGTLAVDDSHIQDLIDASSSGGTTYTAGDGITISSTNAISLTTSGVTANTYGPMADATPAHGATFTVPKLTVDAYGRITGASNQTVRLPADNNTTYSAGTGITISSANAIGLAALHSSNASYGPTVDVDLENGGSFTVPYVTRDTYGRVTGASNKTIKLPTISAGASYSAGTGISISSVNAISLSTSGVTAASYGPSANASPAHSGTFSVPYITVDAYGRITQASTKTITLPADSNTDTLMTQNVSTSNATYPVLLCPTANAAANQGAKTGIFASAVKVNPSTGVLYATSFSGALSGNAASATKLGTSTVGSAWQPIYLNAGTPVAVLSALRTWYAVVESEAVTNNIFKIASGAVTGAYNTVNIVILIQSITSGSIAFWRISLKAGSTAGVFSEGSSTLFNNTNFNLSNFIVAYKSNSGSSLQYELYVKINTGYTGYRFTILQECSRDNRAFGNHLTLTNHLTTTGTSAITSGFTALTTANATVVGSLSGNASTATKQASVAASTGDYADVVNVTTNGTTRVGTIRITNGNGANSILLGVHDESNSAPAGLTIINTNGTVTANLPGTLTANTFVGSLSGNASSATEFSAAKSVTLTGDVTGTTSSKAGWSVATTLANSGVTAGNYGPSANATPSHGATFSVPYITVDAKGRVTSAATRSIKLPADSNTDTLMTQNVSTSNATYPVLLCPTADATTNQGAKTGIFASAVKVNPSTGAISATEVDVNSVHYFGERDFAIRTRGSGADTYLQINSLVDSKTIRIANQGTDYISFYSKGNITASGTVTATTFVGSLTGNASSATEFSAAKSVTLTGDVTGTTSSKAGWSVATTLANSGVTAASYGPSANASPAHGGTFSVPYITVDAKGRITSASTKTITLPADNNTTYSAGTGLSLSSTTFSLANSGVTASSYGPSANASPAHGGTFSVPYLTVDKYGRITSASTKTITLPADNNTTYSAGDGMTLSSTTFKVNSTVVRTSGDQTIGGAKTYTGNCIHTGGNFIINRSGSGGGYGVWNGSFSTSNAYTNKRGGLAVRAISGSVQRVDIECYKAGNAATNDANMTYFSLFDEDTTIEAVIGSKRTSGVTYYYFKPDNNKVWYLGRKDKYWKEIYCASATINTSDKREKGNIQEIDPAVLDVWDKVNLVQFQWNRSLAKHGDAARIHTGAIAQDIRDVFEEAGLDVSRYDFWCYDKWDAEEPVYAPDGTEIKAGVEAGDAYALSYGQFSIIEAAYMRRRVSQLEAKVAELSAKLETLLPQNG